MKLIQTENAELFCCDCVMKEQGMRATSKSCLVSHVFYTIESCLPSTLRGSFLHICYFVPLLLRLVCNELPCYILRQL